MKNTGMETPATEIAAQHPADIVGELDGDRPVEAELEADGGDGFRLGVGAGDDHRRIGRHDLQQAEAKEENPEQSGERDQQAVDDLSSHAPSSDRLDRGNARRVHRRVWTLLPRSRASINRVQRLLAASVAGSRARVTPIHRHAEGYGR